MSEVGSRLYFLHLVTVTINTALLYVALLIEWLADAGLARLGNVSGSDGVTFLLFGIGTICLPLYLWSLLRRLIPRGPAVEDSFLDDLVLLFAFVYVTTLLFLFDRYVWTLMWIPKTLGMVWLGFCLVVSLRFFFRRRW